MWEDRVFKALITLFGAWFVWWIDGQIADLDGEIKGFRARLNQLETLVDGMPDHMGPRLRGVEYKADVACQSVARLHGVRGLCDLDGPSFSGEPGPGDEQAAGLDGLLVGGGDS